MKKHEKEKEFMKSLKSVSVTTSYCGAGHDTDSELESSDSESSEEELSEPDNCIPNSTDTSDDESGEEMSDNLSPLYFLYDCEGTGGSIYKDHIVEIAAVLQPLPSNLHVNTKLPTTFQSLVNTSKRIAAPGKKLNIGVYTNTANNTSVSTVLHIQQFFYNIIFNFQQLSFMTYTISHPFMFNVVVGNSSPKEDHYYL